MDVYTCVHVCAVCISTKDNLRRQAIDFCRRQSESNVIYTETRLCPMLMNDRGLTLEDGLAGIYEGIKEGEKKYGIKVRFIFSFLRQFPGKPVYIFNHDIIIMILLLEWSINIAKLAIKHKVHGVLGVDIAGDELQPMNQEHIDAFQVYMAPACIETNNVS